MAAERTHIARDAGLLVNKLALDEDGEPAESEDDDEGQERAAKAGPRQRGMATPVLALGLAGATGQPAGGRHLGGAGSENAGEGEVVSEPVAPEDHSRRRPVEGGGEVHDKGEEAHREQRARELPRRGAGLECGADELARVYVDWGSSGAIVAGVLELQVGHGVRA